MKIRQGLAAAVIAVLTACTTPTEQDETAAVTAAPDIPIANAVTPTVKVGAAVTFTDTGWQRTFGGALDIPSDANVLYAFVFGGASKAPVSGITLGSQAFTKVKSATGPNGSGLSVYRLVSPSTGSGRQVSVTRSATAYNPTRVTVIAVSGVDAANPNGTMTSVDITPSSATATKTVTIASRDGNLTMSALVAAPSYLNGNGVSATSGYQAIVATGEDADGQWGTLGSAAGASSSVHSWYLRADASGRYAFLIHFSINASSSTSQPGETPPPSQPDTTTPPSGTGAKFGTVATFKDDGRLSSSFGGALQVESSATAVYAVVFNGSGGKAPITGVSLGGRAFTKVKSAERTQNASLDIYRLVSPSIGSQQVTITRSTAGYDPARVSVFTVMGSNITTPNGTITETDITPGSATATKTVSVLSSSDGLTISAVAASSTYLNGTGVSATSGFQTTRATGEDADGVWGVLGSAAGGASVTHSYTLRADQSGRSAYLVSFSINGPSGAPAPPPPPPPPPPLPGGQDGFTTVFDWDAAQRPPLYPTVQNGWTAFERPLEKALYSNLTWLTDATQPGTASTGAVRTTFLPSLVGGYAPAVWGYFGNWPTNTGSLDMTFTIKFSSNWDNNGARNANDGTKLLFFAKEFQNNHFIIATSRRYDGGDGGNGSLGGLYIAVGLQNPTITYKTNVDLARNVWHTVRIQMVGNTPGQRNGRMRIWIDGQQALINTGKNEAPSKLELTDVMYYSSGQVAQQSRFTFESTYGAGSESPPVTQWFDLGHVTAGTK